MNLYKLIGQQITFNNEIYSLIEVMGDEPLLTFQCKTKKEIQHDQHGNANRRSLPTFTIHCLNEARTDLHPTLKGLLDDTEQKKLLDELLIS